MDQGSGTSFRQSDLGSSYSGGPVSGGGTRVRIKGFVYEVDLKGCQGIRDTTKTPEGVPVPRIPSPVRPVEGGTLLSRWGAQTKGCCPCLRGSGSYSSPRREIDGPVGPRWIPVPRREIRGGTTCKRGTWIVPRPTHVPDRVLFPVS